MGVGGNEAGLHLLSGEEDSAGFDEKSVDAVEVPLRVRDEALDRRADGWASSEEGGGGEGGEDGVKEVLGSGGEAGVGVPLGSPGEAEGERAGVERLCEGVELRLTWEEERREREEEREQGQKREGGRREEKGRER